MWFYLHINVHGALCQIKELLNGIIIIIIIICFSGFKFMDCNTLLSKF
jgi:hypothetical protein